jgi:hypothetical protein
MGSLGVAMSRCALSDNGDTATHASGEKCATALPTEIQVGKAIPKKKERTKKKKKTRRGRKSIRFSSSSTFRERTNQIQPNIPLVTLTPLTGLLYTAPVPWSRSLSPSTHRSITFAPSTANSMIFFITSRAISAAIYLSNKQLGVSYSGTKKTEIKDKGRDKRP